MPQEAYASNRFYVEINGIKEAVFTEVGGLQVETAFFDYEEGGNNGHVHRLPGRVKASNLTLKRGISRFNDFFKWQAEVTKGKIGRRNISVVMFDVQGKELMRWHFLGAYPVKWVGPQFNATTSTAVIETLELAHDGIDMG
jgi:phage tail-like protein